MDRGQFRPPIQNLVHPILASSKDQFCREHMSLGFCWVTRRVIKRVEMGLELGCIIIMQLQEENTELSSLVQSMLPFRNCKIQAPEKDWNSNYLEFRLYTCPTPDPQHTLSYFFRLVHIPSHLKYIKDKHRVIFRDFDSLFINVEVQKVTQRIHHCVYLLRAADNYFSLFRLIEKEDRKVVRISFLLNLLEFFDRILRLNEKIRLKIDLTASNILVNDAGLKLADYNLLFHPENIKSKSKTLREDLITKMKYVIFDVLSMRNWENRDKFALTSQELIAKMVEKKANESTLMFTQIIKAFFEEGTIKIEEMTSLRSFLGASVKEESDSLGKSTRTTSDISVPLLDHERDNESEGTFGGRQSTTSRKLNVKRLLLIIVVAVLVVFGIVAGISFYLLERGVDCGKYHYEKAKKCYSCPSSCYSCVDGGEYSCTYCMSNYWLVVNSSSATKGKCSTECRGMKDTYTMHCISQGMGEEVGSNN